MQHLTCRAEAQGHAHVYSHMETQTRVCAHTCTSAWKCRDTHACTHMCSATWKHRDMHAHTCAQTHRDTHAHTRACTAKRKQTQRDRCTHVHSYTATWKCRDLRARAHTHAQPYKKQTRAHTQADAHTPPSPPFHIPPRIPAQVTGKAILMTPWDDGSQHLCQPRVRPQADVLAASLHPVTGG